MKKYFRHIRHYTPLVGVLLAGYFGFITFSYDKGFQFIIAISTASAYVVWGLVHHYIHKDLELSVFFEYLIIAVLGLTVVYSALF